MKHTLLLLTCLLGGLPLQAETLPTTDTLSSVVVTGTRQAIDSRHLPLTVTTISRDQLEQQQQLNLLPAVMEQTPGLFLTSRSLMGYGVSTGAAGSIKVRGVGSMAQLLVLIDGQPQYAGLMGHPIPDAYQTMMAERVEVLRGPASLLYGSNAMGGVVNIVTRQMQHDGQHTQMSLAGGSYGTLQGQVTNQARKGGFSSVVGVNYQRTDGHRPNTNFDQVNGFAKLGYDFGEHWRLRGDLEVTHFNSANPGPQSAPLIDNNMHITRGLTSLSIANDYGRTSGALRGYYDWGRHKIDDGHTADAPAKDYLYRHHDYIAGLSAYQTIHLCQGNRTTVGLDWQHFGGSAWNDYLDADKPHSYLTGTADDHTITQDEVGVYVDYSQDVTRWLSLDVGVRYDWHSQAGSEWIPQAGLALHVSRQGDVKALVSRGFRNPTLRELYMFRPANATLAPERMLNYELAYTHRIQQGKGHATANLYLIKGDNLIQTIFSPELGRMSNENTGAFTHYGFELAADYRISRHWMVDANYSYLHMHTPVVGAPESKLHVGAQYSIGRFTLATHLQNISGLYLSTGASAQKENYTLVNAMASYQAVPRLLRLWVRGENLLAERYQTMLGFPMPKATVMAGVSVEL